MALDGAATARPVVDSRYARDGLFGCLIASSGAALAAIFTNPMDVAQTRLKLQNELLPPGAPRAYTSTLGCMRDTLRSQGVGGLQRGLSLSLVREGSKNFFRLGLYDPLLIRIHADDRAPPPTHKRFAAGFMSGGISALVCNPLDLLKSRVQAVGRRGATVAEIAAVGDSWIRIGQTMVAAEGARSLFKGTGVSVLRSACGTAVTLAVNGSVKDALACTPVPPGFVTDAASAAVAAVALTYTINPPDVVRVRLYNQAVDAQGRGVLYDGVFDCVRKMLRTEGAGAFFKGVGASMYRTIPHVTLTLAFIGSIRREARRREQARLEREWQARGRWREGPGARGLSAA
jgi:solute carrier family 25 protein 34/35